MATVAEELRAAGLEPQAGDSDPALRRECGRLAQELRSRGVRTVGLLPVSDEVATPGVAIALGWALTEQGADVGIIDALGAWSCAPALLGQAFGDGRAVATSRLADRLAVLTARRTGLAGAAELPGVLAQEAGRYSHLLVDLTGFDHLGEHLTAFAVLDGVILVARYGRSTTREVRRLVAQLPAGRGLGALVTGT